LPEVTCDLQEHPKERGTNIITEKRYL